jgi:N6-L-threonylcarbamoyladenine synthase
MNLKESISLVLPPPDLCIGNGPPVYVINICISNRSDLVDNAAMIAWASMHRFQAHDYDDYSINIRARWNIDEI